MYLTISSFYYMLLQLFLTWQVKGTSSEEKGQKRTVVNEVVPEKHRPAKQHIKVVRARGAIENYKVSLSI